MNINTFNLDKKVILITGGYGHLGKAISESLLFHGAEVYVLGKSNERYLKAFDEKQERHKNLDFIPCDISSTAEIKNAFSKVFHSKKKIDVLINNAFYSRGVSPDQMKDEDWNYGIDGSLNSVYRCIREVIPYFKKQKSGKIINVSSMYGVVSPDFDIYETFPEAINPPHYGAAKAGVIQLTKYFANYLGKIGVNVNAVTPGPFPSKKIQENKKFIRELAKKTALNRIGMPEDLAGAFVFLASDAANYITGQNLIIDGGWTSK